MQRDEATRQAVNEKERILAFVILPLMALVGAYLLAGFLAGRIRCGEPVLPEHPFDTLTFLESLPLASLIHASVGYGDLSLGSFSPSGSASEPRLSSSCRGAHDPCH